MRKCGSSRCKHLAMEGFALCEGCRKASLKSRAKKRVDGKCSQCPNKAVAGRRMCKPCLAKSKKKSREEAAECKALGLCNQCKTQKREKGITLCKDCRQQKNDRGKAHRLERKQAVMEAYGGVRCNCCEITDIRFLSMDHIDGGGRKHAEEIGHKLYNWLWKNKFPPGFQVLCFNCNHGRYINGGICPHNDHSGLVVNESK